MSGGVQRKVSGGTRQILGKIIAGGSALIGDLMAQDGDYLEKYSTYGQNTSTFAAARRGVLVAGSQDGDQTEDRDAMCDIGGEWRFPLDTEATAYHPAGTLVAAVGNQTIALLTAGNEAEAIGELAWPVEDGDTEGTFRFFEKSKTT